MLLNDEDDEDDSYKSRKTKYLLLHCKYRLLLIYFWAEC